MSTSNMDAFGSTSSMDAFANKTHLNPELAKTTKKGKIDSKTGLNRASYDQEFKSLFSRLDVLAGILRDAIPEFGNMSLSEIKGRLTEDPNRRGHAEMLNSEDNEGGSLIKYDVLVNVKFDMPKAIGKDKKTSRTEIVDLRLDLEMQRKYNMSYDMSNRVTYYPARMLGSQSVMGSDYDGLQPVRTIWIFLKGIPEGYENSIKDQFFVIRDRHTGKIEPSENFPGTRLITATYIFLSEKFADNTESELIKFLQSVFHSQEGELRYNPYCVDTSLVKEEVEAMGRIDQDLNDIIDDEREQAREEGREEGRKEGREKGIIAIIKTLQDLDFSEEEIITSVLKQYDVSREKVLELSEDAKRVAK